MANATETSTTMTTMNVDDRIDRILIPLHCHSTKNHYGNGGKLWHIHFDDMQMNHYYLVTASESVAQQAMENVNKAVKTRFIVAEVNQFGNCTRIKNLSIKG